jgi:hypothetical protein
MTTKNGNGPYSADYKIPRAKLSTDSKSWANRKGATGKPSRPAESVAHRVPDVGLSAPVAKVDTRATRRTYKVGSGGRI